MNRSEKIYTYVLMLFCMGIWSSVGAEQLRPAIDYTQVRESNAETLVDAKISELDKKYKENFERLRREIRQSGTVDFSRFNDVLQRGDGTKKNGGVEAALVNSIFLRSERLLDVVETTCRRCFYLSGVMFLVVAYRKFFPSRVRVGYVGSQPVVFVPEQIQGERGMFMKAMIKIFGSKPATLAAAPEQH